VGEKRTSDVVMLNGREGVVDAPLLLPRSLLWALCVFDFMVMEFEYLVSFRKPQDNTVRDSVGCQSFRASSEHDADAKGKCEAKES
jgi:hypothetical protein